MNSARKLQLRERGVSYLNGDQIDTMTQPKLENIAYWMNHRQNSPSGYYRQIQIRAPVGRFDYHSGMHEIGNPNPYDPTVKVFTTPPVRESDLVMQLYQKQRKNVVPRQSKKEAEFYRVRFPHRWEA